jgi:ATP-binding cassette subfamily F protein 3
MGRSVLEEANDTPRMNPDLFVRTVLGTFLFRDDMVYKKVSVLSDGEKSRLALVKLLLDPPNVLLLDEPTTHLDMASVQALIDALKEFEGTICFISHDLYFINALADHVVHVEAGKITVFPGNYEYFQRRQAQLRQESQDGAGPSAGKSSHSVPKPAQAHHVVKSSSEDMQRFREAEKNRSKARKKVNARIREIEAELEDLNTRIGSVFIQSDYQKLTELDTAIKALEKELADKKAELERLA